MQHLILHLIENSQSSFEARWALFKDNIKIQEQPLSRSLQETQFPVTETDCFISVLIPGIQVTLTQVKIAQKQLRHLRKLLPFLIEDQLADDVEDLHIVANLNAYQSGSLPIAVIRKSSLQQWLNSCHELGITPDAMLPEILAIPFKLAPALICESNSALLRYNENEGIVCEQDLLPTIISTYVSETKAIPTHTIECYVSESTPNGHSIALLTQIQNEHPELSLLVKNVSSASDILYETAVNNRATLNNMNLLQGAFKPASKKNPSEVSWKKTVRTACFLFVGLMMFNVIQVVYLSYKTNGLRKQTILLYQSIYPDDKKIVEPLAQMKAHLSQSNAKNNNGFLQAMQKIGYNLDSQSTLQITNIRYNADTRQTNIDVTMPTIDALNGLVQKLNTSAMTAKTLGVVSEKDNVKSQLVITEKVDE